MHAACQKHNLLGLTRLAYTPQAAVLGQGSKQLFMVRYSAEKTAAAAAAAEQHGKRHEALT
jgi:hypothetical protein